MLVECDRAIYRLISSWSVTTTPFPDKIGIYVDQFGIYAFRNRSAYYLSALLAIDALR
jgi:hypothetical protein